MEEMEAEVDGGITTTELAEASMDLDSDDEEDNRDSVEEGSETSGQSTQDYPEDGPSDEEGESGVSSEDSGSE